jgi:hypothetical protein
MRCHLCGSPGISLTANGIVCEAHLPCWGEASRSSEDQADQGDIDFWSGLFEHGQEAAYAARWGS